MTIISPKFVEDGNRLDAEEALRVAHRKHVERNAARVDAAARKAAPKLRKKYKEARRRLLELVVWQNPQMSMGAMPRGMKFVPPADFVQELQRRADEVTIAFDLWTECTVTFDPDVPKL